MAKLLFFDRLRAETRFTRGSEALSPPTPHEWSGSQAGDDQDFRGTASRPGFHPFTRFRITI
ncbi:MAG: hypothetical protein WD733_09440 [Bryobacterales bacterium]